MSPSDDPTILPTAGADPVSVRRALEDARAALLAEIEATIETPGPMTYGSQAAAASHVFEQQRDLALRDRAAGQLVLVDAALARLSDGTYGRCVRCGAPIAPDRLEALPWAEMCIACARIAGPGGTG